MNNRVVIVCITVITVFVIGAGILLANTPDGGDGAVRSIGLLVAILAPTFSTLTLLVKQDKVKQTLDQTNANTDKLTNGFMDDKLQANIHKVMNDREKGIRQ